VPYRFLAVDLDALEARLQEYERRLREARSGIHAATTQSSETWHDNPMFDEAQQQAKMWDSERRKLADIRNDSMLVEPGHTNGRVDLGTTVTVRDARTDGEDTYTIGSYLVLGDDGSRISYNSPLGQLLLGRAVGDLIEGKLGSSTVRLQIVDVSDADS
jgi:transcription elongation factor GreA